MTEYISFDGSRREWNPDTAVNYFLIVDKPVVAENGSYMPYGALFYGNSAREVRSNLLDFIHQNPDFVFSWRDAGAKIVKAPCAFDAKKTHVVIEVL